MRGNFFDSFIGITGFGESHGKAVGVILEDIKPNIIFPLKKIQAYLDERRPGKSIISSARKEADRIEVLSGVFENKTTGLPICLLIWNTDAKSSDYENLKNIFRPGHADFGYFSKFKIYDYRGGGRASGRETIARVAASGLADTLLKNINIKFDTIRIGDFVSSGTDLNFENNLQWHDQNTYHNLENYLLKIKENEDSVGGIIKIEIKNVPAGLGDPVFEKLDANLAKAVLSIGSIKGIEFGSGFEFGKLTGSLANDQMNETGFMSNKSGGILGGISNGNKIEFQIVVKPTPSIGIEQKTIDADNNEHSIITNGRHDVCIIPRIIPVVKAMIKLVLADAIQYQNLIESKETTLENLRESIDKIDEDILLALRRRKEIVKQVAAHKKQYDKNIQDSNREKLIFEKLSQKAELLNIDKNLVKNLWQEIINSSKDDQHIILNKKK